MSSIPRHRSHLTSTDMSMIMRVYASVCAKDRIAFAGLAAELPAAFMTDRTFGLSIPIDKMDRSIGNALHRWEIDGETVSH